ncbi:hypothetical protein [Streptomyces sp. HUAS TT7]|uniref:hypothetical protein n=1 Tax=Streptomyces sp. HUAS TT7 TaxID=3447507 RepID=UPI003F657427
MGPKPWRWPSRCSPLTVTSSALTAPSRAVEEPPAPAARIDEGNGQAKGARGIHASATPQGSCHTYSCTAVGENPTRPVKVCPLTGKATDIRSSYAAPIDRTTPEPVLTDARFDPGNGSWDDWAAHPKDGLLYIPDGSAPSRVDDFNRTSKPQHLA